MKQLIIILTLVFLVGGLAAAQVVDPRNPVPADVVGARKALMRAIGAQAGAIRGGAQNGDLDAVKAAGATLSALAGVIPVLFQEGYANVYPVGGSKYAFEPGDAADLRTKAAALQAAADAAATASSVSAVNTRALFGACGQCHGTFRREL